MGETFTRREAAHVTAILWTVSGCLSSGMIEGLSGYVRGYAERALKELREAEAGGS